MNSDIFEHKWNQMRSHVKIWWADLTDQDLDKVDGKFENFSGLLQEKYGYDELTAREEWEKRTTWQATNK